MRHYYLSTFILCSALCLSACQHSKQQNIPSHKQHVILKGFSGTKVNSYIKDNQSNNYKFVLGENLGHQRTEIEQAMMKFPLTNHSMSFTILSEASINQLDTPLTILEVYDKNNIELMTLKIKSDYAWIETPQKYVEQVPLYLNTQNANIKIMPLTQRINLDINGKNYEVPIQMPTQTAMIGLKRTDLMRYIGKKVPKQTMQIENVRFEN